MPTLPNDPFVVAIAHEHPLGVSEGNRSDELASWSSASADASLG